MVIKKWIIQRKNRIKYGNLLVRCPRNIIIDIRLCNFKGHLVNVYMYTGRNLFVFCCNCNNNNNNRNGIFAFLCYSYQIEVVIINCFFLCFEKCD